MFCPNCGREHSEPRKFCPSCGLRLQVIAEVLAEEKNFTREGEEVLELPSVKPSFWQSSLALGVIVMILGTILSILGKNIFASVSVTTLGTIMAVMGIGVIGLNGVGRIVRETMSLPKATPKHPSITTAKLPLTLPTEDPVSITEHTTRKLQWSESGQEHQKAGE